MADLSLHHLTMIHHHPLEVIEAAAAGGFSHCGLRLVAPRPGDPLVDVLNEPGAIASIDSRLKALGVKLLDIEAVWLGPDTSIESLRPAMEAGERLGARYLLTVGNDPDASRQQDNFEALCALAKEHHLKVGLEFISYCEINSLEKAFETLAKSNAENAGLLIDALQFFRSGSSPTDLTPSVVSRILYAQICDGRKAAPATIDERRFEAREDRLLPGDGQLPIRELLRALPRDIALSLEAPTASLKGMAPEELGRVAGQKLRQFLDAEMTAS
ncbi:sugar phosphate isomerase/epimerase family protein (plasmid) [Rhizobium leguminosarum]